jgi:hypothetical protein
MNNLKAAKTWTHQLTMIFWISICWAVRGALVVVVELVVTGELDDVWSVVVDDGVTTGDVTVTGDLVVVKLVMIGGIVLVRSMTKQ